MTTRPGYVWDATASEWVEIGQAAVVAPIAYQTSAPSSPATGDIWIDSDAVASAINTNDFLLKDDVPTTAVYKMNAGTTAARPTGAAGLFRFNTTTGYPEWYDVISSSWSNFYQQRPVIAEYLVIAGGGGSMQSTSGGGGAGGYRNSTSGELSGANSSTETPLTLLPTAEYTVTVGAGAGPGGASGPVEGGSSQFHSVISRGGGGGGGNSWGGRIGGSGGGGQGGAGAGTALQGFAGGSSSGGGGGAGAIGIAGGVGGDGLSSSITGTPVTRAGGGGGYNNRAGGAGGGGAGSTAGVNGTANTGGGAGGANSSPGRNGGSGIVIVRYSDAFTITIGAGLTATTTTVGTNKVTTFTAGTGVVSFA
jgi:hypothetical protein